MCLVPNVKDDTSYFYLYIISNIVTVLGPLLAVMDHLIILVYLVKMVWMADLDIVETKASLHGQNGEMGPIGSQGTRVSGFTYQSQKCYLFKIMIISSRYSRIAWIKWNMTI